ncbi:MAG: MBOAT family O-acyltransferase [Thermoanaerobaculia bacterium]|nr:MBOAT family O-acyltransferase [Thermoanaerobaculia bacterium]
MIFTSFTYLYFLAAIFAVYWILGARRWQNLMLLAASYTFYGWVHPWFCFLIAFSTSVDYACGLGMERYPSRRRSLLVLSLAANLGLLGTFKYFGFFVDNWQAALATLGFETTPITLQIFLPVGISFYTFQSLSYTLDIYRGQMRARRSLLDFALFVSFFPQLVAGPIERARRFLPQIETARTWNWNVFASAWPLLLRGYVKKLVVADNIAVYADQVFALSRPAAPLLAVGTLAFAIQIYADFSAYTDIARGSARLLGFHLSENFRSPYTAVSPSQFWKRWHISFSSWITDYLYIPLGGSRVRGAARELGVLLVTMGLSGLWHGAAWNFVAWGVFHALLLFGYRRLGFGSSWRPTGVRATAVATTTMFAATLVGWMLFRAPSLSWLARALTGGLEVPAQAPLVAAAALALIAVYSLPLLVMRWLEDRRSPSAVVEGLAAAAAVLLLAVFARSDSQAFIYFQF